MATTTALIFVGKFVLSFIFAILIIYVVDEGHQKEKYQKIDRLLSQLLQFIIYIWLAKIVWGIPLLFNHPLSVLAYPSNSTHFYTATVLWGIHFYWKYRKRTNEIEAALNDFLWAVLLALLMYEFLEIIINPNAHLNFYFVALTVIVAIMTLYQKMQWTMALTFNAWLLLSFILSLSKGYYPVFNYFLQPYYFMLILFSISGVYFILNKMRKQKV